MTAISIQWLRAELAENRAQPRFRGAVLFRIPFYASEPSSDLGFLGFQGTSSGAGTEGAGGARLGPLLLSRSPMTGPVEREGRPPRVTASSGVLRAKKKVRIAASRPSSTAVTA
jgi:hypothetical protein